MSASGVGWPQFVKGIMNTGKYITKFKTRTLPSAKGMFLERDFVFQDDNAPCHLEKYVQNLFVSSKIMFLQYPGQSLDLNST